MGIDFSKINSRINNKERAEISREDVLYNNENAASVNEELSDSREKVIANAIAKINEIEKDLNGSFIERESEIEMLILGLLSATNCFLHGPAGTGKSQLTEELSKRITNSNYFRILMGKTTEPAEVFGPVSINSLKNDKYKVITDNKLPKAEIAFLDEVFKANSAVLNSLLTIMNEKLFFNDVTEQVPTISVIGASNEYPEEDNLTALYDRFLLRWPVSYIQNPTARVELFEKFLDSRKSTKVAATISNSISIGELRLLIEEAKDVKIPKKVLITYNTLLTKIQNTVGLTISDRRKNEALKVMQALALKRGLDTATTAEFEALKYIFWQREDQIQQIVDILNPFINPYQVAYDEYNKLIQSCREKLSNNEANKSSSDSDATVEQTIVIAQIKTTVTKAISKLNKFLNSEELNETMRDKFEAVDKELNTLLLDIKEIMSDFTI